MTAAYPKMLFARVGRGTMTVADPEGEAMALASGFTDAPSVAHHAPERHHAPEPVPGDVMTSSHIPVIVSRVVEALAGGMPGTDGQPGPLTEAHIPVIVDQVFERLRGMAVAAAGEPAHRETAEAVAALHEGLDERFDALKGDLLGEIRALIAPAPVVTGKKA